LLTTNTELTFEKAFEIYATRWTIKERILLIIKEILTEYSENMDLGIDFFLEHIFAENEQFKNLINFQTLARAA